jgi:CheY-like chemotaxis protein
VVDGLKVLVVDDEPVVAESLAVQLAGDGWQVLVAHDGKAALSLVETHRPICALIDLKMPGMDGTELAQHLRARWKDEIVLIAITGWGGEHVALRSLSGILCARHSMTRRSMYAKQEDDEGGRGRGGQAADDPQGAH